MKGKKTKRGGKRAGSGAKAKEDKKKPVTIYVYQSKIDKLGIEKLKELLYSAISE